MVFLEISHNAVLVAASLVVALVAGFAGFTLTSNLAAKSVSQKKIAIALASISLGGGIWSMHFVAMLGMQLPVLFYYDAAITLASALMAILVVSLALILLHFRERTPGMIAISGGLVALGVLSMHYIGMSGLQLCRAIYTPSGVLLSIVAALVLCVAAFWIAYGERRPRNVLLGTVCFGFAVFTVHFVAIANTSFIAVPSFSEIGPLMSNETLAIGVILSSFAIFAAFLWVGVTYITPPLAPADGPEPPVSDVSVEIGAGVEIAPAISTRVLCERNGQKIYVAARDVSFIRADGHYTQVYTDTDRLFCVWPITEASKRLRNAGLIQVHRSYLINPAKVAAFARKKDSGRCIFSASELPEVPVSRSKLKIVEATLGA